MTRSSPSMWIHRTSTRHYRRSICNRVRACPAKRKMTNLTLTKTGLVESVLRLKPRVAAFDCDGTLWSGDAGERFFDWEIKQRVVPTEVGEAMRARYIEYRAGR